MRDWPDAGKGKGEKKIAVVCVISKSVLTPLAKINRYSVVVG